MYQNGQDLPPLLSSTGNLTPSLIPTFSTVTPPFTENNVDLTSNQAFGKVTAVSDYITRVSVECANSGAWPDDGSPLELMCLVRSSLSKVIPGDDVMVDAIDWDVNEGIIENVFERESEIAQIANVRNLMVLFSLDQPEFNESLLTRYLVATEASGVAVMVVVNKSELVDRKTKALWKSKLRSWGYEPLFCSAKNKTGLKALLVNLRDQTTVIVGPSGVGMSHLMNALGSNCSDSSGFLSDDSFDLSLRKIWLDQALARHRRQEHATHRDFLLPLCGGGYLADSRGFNLPSLSHVTKESLALCFHEVRKMIMASGSIQCASSDCLHIGETGCLVTTAWERYPLYCELLKEIEIRDECQVSTLGTKH